MKNKIINKKQIPEEFSDLIDESIEIRMINKMPFSKKINEKRSYQRKISKEEAQSLE